MDADRLAALLEGRLRGSERAAAIAELAALPDTDFGVFAEATKVLREQEKERKGGKGRGASTSS